MGIRETKLPSIPEPTQDNYLDVIRAIKEVMEVGVLSITRGDELDSNVTYRYLYEFGYYGSNTGGASGSPNTPPPIVPPIDGPFPPPVEIPGDLPGRPTNVTTHAVWDAIQVQWDWPTAPNTHWERAAVHASTTKTFLDGNIVGYTTTNFFIHTGVGLSDPSGDGDGFEPGVRWYWVRFEATDLITGELKATEWTPYNYEDGVMGITATDISATIESFRLGSSTYPELEAISPFVAGQITVGYTEGGDPIRELAIGLDGNFLVDGTITARTIQAHSIGATEIRAESIWAGLMETNKIITSQLSTRGGEDFRLEINGEGTSWEFFPLWYGRGETGGDGGLFWIQNYDVSDGETVYRVSSLFLTGEMYVTGIGKFFGGYITYDEAGNVDAVQRALRIEIGGPDSGFILWAGSGLTGVGDGTPESESQPIFFIDNLGNAVFTGTVDAKFVAGEISRTALVRHDYPGEGLRTIKSKAGNISEIKESEWTHVGEYELPEPPFATGHIPHISIQWLMYGLRQDAGAARLQYKLTPAGAWVDLSASAYDLDYGGQQQLVGIVVERVHGKMWVRFSVAGFNNKQPWINKVRGLLMGIR